MILSFTEVEELTLKKNDEGKYITVSPENLDINEKVHIENSDNEIKKISDTEFMFIRKDSVDTHIRKSNTKHNFNSFKNKINTNIDYQSKYADERNNLLTDALNKNEDMIGSLISSNKVIKSNIKKTTDFLAEDQEFYQLLDSIAEYLTHSKFLNEEDEERYNSYKELRDKLTNKKNPNKEDLKLLDEVNSIIDKYDTRLNNHFKILKNDETLFELLHEDEDHDGKQTLEVMDSSEEKRLDTIRKRFVKKRKFNVNFWGEMGYNADQKAWRNDVINNYEQSLKLIKEYLGYNIEDKEEREKYQDELIKSFKPIKYTHKGKEREISPYRQISIMKNIHSGLAGDFKESLKILTDQIKFKRLDKTSTGYQWNEDTYYIDESDNEVEVSNNIFQFSNPASYKGLLNNYGDLKEKYSTDFNSDMWAILYDFDELVKQTEFDEIEQFIVDCLLDDMDAKEIYKDLVDYLPDENLTNRKFYRYIDTYIPNKLLDTYISSVDDWIYTYQLKGKFKKCSKCGEIKVVSNDRYFSPKTDAKDGFHPYCKACR